MILNMKVMRMNTSQSIVEVRNLFYRYDKENVLENINFTVQEGDYLGIVGPNGSGKSTLIKLILQLLKQQSGEILLFGVPIGQFKDWEKIGFVSQKANSFNSGFPATVFEVVASGLTKKIGLFRFFTKRDHQKVKEAIAAVGMEQFSRSNIGELSGGQQQRVFIARALVSDPSLLILDEPTVGVDAKNVHAFYEMLAYLNKKLNITLMLVTHDIGTITDKVTHIACLNRHLHFHGDVNEFTQEKVAGLTDFYGHGVHLLPHHHEHPEEVQQC